MEKLAPPIFPSSPQRKLNSPEPYCPIAISIIDRQSPKHPTLNYQSIYSVVKIYLQFRKMVNGYETLDIQMQLSAGKHYPASISTRNPFHVYARTWPALH
jgi:hypothetical protein